MISSARTSVSALRPPSRSFGGRVQTDDNVVAPLSGARATGDQDEALRDDPHDDLRDDSPATTTEEDYGEEAVRMRQARSRYDGNRKFVDGEDNVLGKVLNDRA